MASERMALKRAALRGRIVDAALQAFAARGFEATTTVDIAHQLQMTGPALYHYFRTKDDLRFACIEQVLQNLHEALSSAAAAPGSAAERMARVVRAQVTMELKNGSSAPLVNAHLYGPQYLTDMLQPAQQETLREEQLRTLIDQGIAGGEFRVASAAVAAFNVLAVVQYSGVWYRPRKGRRMADLIDAQVAAALQLLGVTAPVSPPPPRKARP